jgi:hypothetical protein
MPLRQTGAEVLIDPVMLGSPCLEQGDFSWEKRLTARWMPSRGDQEVMFYLKQVGFLR